MLVAAAVVPNPPLLVPVVAGELAPDLEACRVACGKVIGALLDARLDLLVVIGGGATRREHDRDAVGSLRPYGVDELLGLGSGPRALPLSLGVARWLLGPAPLPPLALYEIRRSETTFRCAALGQELSDRGARVGLLVAADGSAYPSQTPVGDDGRGGAYDERWTAALEHGDGTALLDLDPADDTPLWVAGRAALQVLGGALVASGGDWAGELAWRGAPYGVGYAVAALRRQ